MKYRLHSGWPLDKTIPSILSNQIAKAAKTLKNPKNIVEAIHSARKTLKRVDALLFLSEPIALSHNVKHKRKKLKDLARRLSQKRDADVIAGALDALHQDYGKPENEDDFFAIETWLQERSTRIHAARGEGDLAAIAKGLKAMQPSLAALKFQPANQDAIIMTAAETYGRGRAIMKKAFAADEEQVWHGWRRYVQRHARHMALLKSVWAEEIDARVALAKKVASLLGLHHDLAVLRQVLLTEYCEEGQTKPVRWLLDLIAKKQTKLEKQIIPLGKLLFAEKPKAFLLRFRMYCLVRT